MMTFLRVAVGEDLLTTLQAQADLLRKSPEQVATTKLREGLLQLPAVGRAVVVSGAALEQLEQILGGGSLLNGADLQKKVARLAGISFLHVRLPFSPSQLEQLVEKAARNSLTVDQLVERTAPRMYEQFFDLVERSH